MTENEFILKNAEWIDRIAEQHDHMGTCLGVALTTIVRPGLKLVGVAPVPEYEKSRPVDVVVLTFDHGVIIADQSDLRLLYTLVATRFDEMPPGEGKSAIVRQVAEAKNIPVKEIRLSQITLKCPNCKCTSIVDEAYEEHEGYCNCGQPMFRFQARRPLDEMNPDGYMESDRDFIENNRELAVAFLNSLET